MTTAWAFHPASTLRTNRRAAEGARASPGRLVRAVGGPDGDGSGLRAGLRGTGPSVRGFGDVLTVALLTAYGIVRISPPTD
ncbi:hypothetical protein GCM10010214_33140 [Streptomyces abikoensis]|nr:hypothetical protein GCM10010214_33140 [Streptomyces abikoensis]